jgi:segregation and condensation protein B
MSLTDQERRAALEAIIYAADEPVTTEQLAEALEEDKSLVCAALDDLVASCAAEDRGVEIRAVAGGWKVYTKPQHHELVRRFIRSLKAPLRLTMPALETLAVIAYKQPVTLPEIQEIRDVNCAGVIKTLLERRLIVTTGRKQVIGRPILYRTSKDFLMRFGLNDLDELPSLKEFEQLAREALGTDEGIVPVEEGSGESRVPSSEPVGAEEARQAASAEAAQSGAVGEEPSGNETGERGDAAEASEATAGSREAPGTDGSS